jgi:glycosyltransferase involved in cell wall biosynthesis
MNTKIQKDSVSVVMPMRNSSTTVVYALQSILLQKYRVKEIIVIDNASTDNSLHIVREFAKKSKIPIKLISRKINKGLGASFNEGVKNTSSPLVILMHSDCSLGRRSEIDRLITPFKVKTTVASYPTILLTEKVWEKYDFWEKCFFARGIEKGIAGLTTKFDCIKKDAYQKIGGFDIKNFGVGGEDADLHERLSTLGKVVKSSAQVTHLHYLGEKYTLQTYLTKQRLYARTYGRLIRTKGLSLIPRGFLLFVKPMLAILPFLPLPYLQIVGISFIILFAFSYTYKMFMTKSTLLDSRILLLPFVNIFIIYYETFWIIESFLFGKNKIE